MIPLPLRIVGVILIGAVLFKVIGGAMGSWMMILAILLWLTVILTLMYEFGWLNFASKIPLLNKFFGFMSNRAAVAGGAVAASDAGPRGKLSDEDRQKLLIEAQTTLNGLMGLDAERDQINQRILDPADEDPDNPFATQAPALVAVFAGPPGTGKTTAAVATAQILAGKSVLETANIVTVRELDLRSGNFGSAANLAQTMARQAIDGTLLIENAGWLLANDPYGGPGPGGDFGEALLDVVNQHPQRILIMMTCTDEEAEKMGRTPTISRWLGKLTTRTVFFDDLADDTLLDLLETRLSDVGWALLDDDAAAGARRLMAGVRERADLFDNAESCRRVAETLVEAARNDGRDEDKTDRVIHGDIVRMVDDQIE